MKRSNLEELIKRSLDIRAKYHQLEVSLHGSRWTIEEDALAFLTDAGLVGRNVMANQNRWPNDNSEEELRHKIGECMWWLIVLADRLVMNPKDLIEDFLTRTEKKVSI